MGRKSLVTERQTQLLDAFETCIVRDGLAGATLQRVADEAGVKLSVIHHYIGKRQDLINAMVARFIERYQTDTQAYLQQLPTQNRLSHLLDFYFSATGVFYQSQDTVILNALLSLGDRDPQVKQQLNALYTQLVSDFDSLIAEADPDKPIHARQAMAHNLLSLWLGHATLRWLGFSAETDTWARQACLTFE